MLDDFSNEYLHVRLVHVMFSWLETLHEFLECRLGSRVGGVVRNGKRVPRESRCRSWSFNVRRDEDTTLTFWMSYRPSGADLYALCGVLVNGEESGYRPEPSLNPLENDKRGVMDYFDLAGVEYAA